MVRRNKTLRSERLSCVGAASLGIDLADDPCTDPCPEEAGYDPEELSVLRDEVQRLTEDNQRLQAQHPSQPASQEEELVRLRKQLAELTDCNESLQGELVSQNRKKRADLAPAPMDIVDGKRVMDLTALRPADSRPPLHRPRSTIFPAESFAGESVAGESFIDCDLTAMQP